MAKKQKRTVFVVWTGQYSDKDVQGIYSTREGAEQAAVLFQRDDARVVEVEADEHLTAVQRGLMRWTVYMQADGDVDFSYHSGRFGTGEAPTVGDDGGDGCVIECDARDEDHAVKIAADMRRVFLLRAAGGDRGNHEERQG